MKIGCTFCVSLFLFTVYLFKSTLKCIRVIFTVVRDRTKATMRCYSGSLHVTYNTYTYRHLSGKFSGSAHTNILAEAEPEISQLFQPYGSCTLRGTGTGIGTGTGPANDRFLYYAMYCTHYTGTGNHCFLLFLSGSLSLFHAVGTSH